MSAVARLASLKDQASAHVSWSHKQYCNTILRSADCTITMVTLVSLPGTSRIGLGQAGRHECISCDACLGAESCACLNLCLVVPNGLYHGLPSSKRDTLIWHLCTNCMIPNPWIPEPVLMSSCATLLNPQGSSLWLVCRYRCNERSVVASVHCEGILITLSSHASGLTQEGTRPPRKQRKRHSGCHVAYLAR